MRTPEDALLIARRWAGDPGGDQHVEIESLAAALVLHLIGEADGRVNADALEAVRIDPRKPFLRAALYQDLKSERPAARPLDEKAVLDGVAGFAKERQRALRHRPVAPRAVGNGRFPAAFEDVIAHRAGKGRQERTLAGLRWATGGGELGVIEEASRSAIETAVNVGVHPLEVEHHPERLTHSNISKDRPARVEGEALHSLWQAIGQAFLDDAAVPHRGKIVGAYPTRCSGI